MELEWNTEWNMKNDLIMSNYVPVVSNNVCLLADKIKNLPDKRLKSPAKACH